jgi:hypothetical protein
LKLLTPAEPCPRRHAGRIPGWTRIEPVASNGTATAGTLTFASGETTKTITSEVKGDSKKEADETFYLDLFGLSGNARFTKNRGLGTILNDD